MAARRPDRSARDKAAQAEADLALTAAWLRIASAISGGLGDEGEAATADNGSASMALVSKKLLEAGQGRTLSFQDFESGYPQYAALKGALAQYRDIRDAGGWLAIPEGESVEAGDSDPRIPAIRQRLSVEGYINAPEKDGERMLLADAGRLNTVSVQERNPEESGDRRTNLVESTIDKMVTDETLSSDDLVRAGLGSMPGSCEK